MFQVFVDSAANIPAEIVKRYGIHVISFVNFAAVILGQVIGDRIRAYNISTITPDMDAGKTAMLHGHPGFEIWLMTLVLTVAIFLIAGKVKHHIDLKKRYKTD